MAEQNSLRKEKRSERSYQTMKSRGKTNGRSGKKTGKSRSSSVNTSAKNTKKTSAAKTADKQMPPETESGIRMGNEVMIITSFGIMILLLLSNFGLCGKVGRILKSLFFGVFGFSQYFMPLVFFVIIMMLIANDYSALSIKKSAALLIIMLSLSAFAELISVPEGYIPDQLFGDSAVNPFLGGVVAGGAAEALRSGFGTAGAFIIVTCVLILAVVMLTQRSVIAFFRGLTVQCAMAAASFREKQALRKEERDQKDDNLILEMDAIYDREEEEWAFPDRDFAMPADKQRVSDVQVENKVREIEDQINKSRKKTKKTRENNENSADVQVPVFVPTGNIKKNDSLRELRPEAFPFTKEDGQTDPFKGDLDYSAFVKAEAASLPEIAIHDNNTLDKKAAGKALQSAEEILLPESEAGEMEDDFFNIIEDLSGDNEEDKQVETTVEFFGAGATKKRGQTDRSVKKENPSRKEKDTDSLAEDSASTDSTSALIENDKTEKENTEKEKTEPDSAKVVEEFDEEEKQKININRASQPKPVSSSRKNAASSYIFPPMTLLTREDQELSEDFDEQLRETALKLQQTLKSFGVNVTITDISCGPSVTRYELFPEQGVKVSRIVSLTDDIKLNLAAADIRIEAPIPGKAAIGIEVPNTEKQTVHFRDLIDNRTFRNMKSRLSFAAGKDISGKIVMADLAKMPHMLVAGTTGSGKSVFINTIIMSILYKATPEEVRFIMIDPKMVELNVYNGIPHLLIPVVTDPKKASGALNWAVAEMTDRYKKFADRGTRNLTGYNRKVEAMIKSGEASEEEVTKLPQIVIIIDELADLMMVAKSEVEDAIVRLSQLARAAGIHMVIATQRPSVDVITGLIKANVPSRVALSVSSGTDSRTIIDMNGAEKLLGNGDMLFYPSGYQKPVRVQGAYISDDDIIKVTDFLKENVKAANYDKSVAEKIDNKISSASTSQERDEYFEAAARFVIDKDKATIGMLQRMFKIGFNRAARIVDQLYEAGIVGPEEGTKPRKVLMGPEELDRFFEENA